MDTILELLNNLFEKQYSKNLKNFLLYESEYDMKFSANNNRRVFPFFLGNNLGYKLSKFEENYNVFCENYKLKEEFSFLNNLYKKSLMNFIMVNLGYNLLKMNLRKLVLVSKMKSVLLRRDYTRMIVKILRRDAFK